MKRGVDEKNMGPMFPRLHVNDTEKGGPRAPPRNKMALYEQLSIPSHRNSSSNNAPPPSSSSQGGESQRGSFFPLQRTSLMHAADKTNNRYSNLNNQLIQQEQKKKQEEDDFRVPILLQQSGTDHSGNQPFGSAFSTHIKNIQKASERNNNSQELAKSGSNQSSRHNTKVQSKESNGNSSSFGHRNGLNNSGRLQSNGNSRDHVVDSPKVNNVRGNSVSNENIRGVRYGNPLLPVMEVQEEVMRGNNDPINGDAVSESSMVDSICGADISPDDVVGIIGQKHFWKARRAIVNQQRVFGVQLFELHRLIKVQRLIAGLPQPVIDADAFIEKPTKVSPIKKIPLEYTHKSSTNIPKLKEYSEKPKDDTREFSAENAVEKASFSSAQNNSFSGYPFPPPDPRMGPWSMNHPTGHQWLIPVMSPSEGLIYKPYPGPPPGIGHNFVNHGVPPPPQPQPPPPQAHYQWPTGFHSMVHPPPHGYFPPYNNTMTTINTCRGEETNPFNTQTQYQSSVNTPTMPEVQVSEASSPNDPTPNRDALPLFPMCPPNEAEPARAIRVVPRNARLATESVARIFQSIQDERKRQDSV